MKVSGLTSKVDITCCECVYVVDSEASRQEEISARTRNPAPSNPHERQCTKEYRENVML